MNKIFSVALSIIFCICILDTVCFALEDNTDQKAYEYAWNHMTEDEQYNASLDIQAWSVGLSVEEFSLFASVVQAECDGTTDFDTGKVHVAVCIWDRYYSDSWPSTITGVLTQSGQFTTVSGGSCYTRYTTASRWAVIKGKEAVLNGDIPNNLYWFNCISYCHTPYAYVGDNYFSTTGSPAYFENAYEIKTEDGIEIREIHRMTIEEEMAYLRSKEVTIVDE